ncbi:hypothetical protein [Methyloferula stellata]|uniref:hypothetical protein n=1 Tax=Methyloferula stellata TaxID=876270 RepID=UPI00037A54F3|nr:hypothetical protein [Methyloferula stellata]
MSPSGRPIVLLATPCYGGQVNQAYMLSVCKLLQAASDGGFTLDLALLANDALIPRARSTLVAAFLDQPRATHLLFVDSDIAFATEQFERMLAFDKDFVAGLYPLKTIDWDAVPKRVVGGEKLDAAGLSYVGTLLDPAQRKVVDGFATAKYAGTGFQLIKRVVFERLIAAHPELRFTSIHALAREAPKSSNLYALFDCLIDPDTGTYLSEDYAFCQRWRALGGDIWLDLKSKLTHVGPDHFKGDAATRYREIG